MDESVDRRIFLLSATEAARFQNAALLAPGLRLPHTFHRLCTDLEANRPRGTRHHQ